MVIAIRYTYNAVLIYKNCNGIILINKKLN